jgi:hypothetical protein
MRIRNTASRWLSAVLILVIFCLLATACGNSTGSVASIPHPPTPPLQRSAAVGASTVFLTTSGGISGSVTISANPLAHQGILTAYQQTATKQFFVSVTGTDQQHVLINFRHYAGPGTYQVMGGSKDDALEVTLGQQHTVWLLNVKLVGTCTVVVASDTVVPGDTTEVGGSPTKVKAVDEVKGTLDCPSLPPLSAGPPPLQVSQGQFDVFMDQLA